MIRSRLGFLFLFFSPPASNSFLPSLLLAFLPPSPGHGFLCSTLDQRRLVKVKYLTLALLESSSMAYHIYAIPMAGVSICRQHKVPCTYHLKVIHALLG